MPHCRDRKTLLRVIMLAPEVSEPGDLVITGRQEYTRAPTPSCQASSIGTVTFPGASSDRDKANEREQVNLLLLLFGVLLFGILLFGIFLFGTFLPVQTAKRSILPRVRNSAFLDYWINTAILHKYCMRTSLNHQENCQTCLPATQRVPLPTPLC